MPATLARTAAPTVHATTGLPVQPVAEFAVGDLVTESIMGDGNPAVVVHIEGKGKTVYVAQVNFVLGNVSPDDAPGYNGYGDSATLVIDPASVEAALAVGKDGSVTKYVLKVGAKPRQAYSISEREQVGPVLHNAKWGRPGQSYGSLSQGARFRRDPHR